MKKLIIVRHGKSSWEYDGILDIDRPLKQRGIRNGYEMAQRLNDVNIIPKLIYSSPATRALHSAVIFCRQLKIPFENLQIVDEFYHFDAQGIVDFIKKTSDEVDALMIFGHNPVFTELANEFAKQEIDNVPTTGVVLITFDVENWVNISPKSVVDDVFDYPKNKSTNFKK
jgi:phosphohistidine phosphatase